MSRFTRVTIAILATAALAGCKTSEINAGQKLGMSGDYATGTPENGYGDHRGDAIYPPGSETVHGDNTETKGGE